MQQKKQRFPGFLTAFSAFLVLLCFSLMSCGSGQPAQTDSDQSTTEPPAADNSAVSEEVPEDSLSLDERLAQRTMEDYPYIFNFTPVFTDLLQREDGDRVLMLVRTEGTPHAAGLEHLLLGVYDKSVSDFVGDSWDIGGDEGLYACWTGEDGSFSLLCANSVTYQGEESSCGLSYYRFADGELERLYAVPDAAFSTGLLSSDDQAAQAMLYDYFGEEEVNDLSYSFWETRKCVPMVGGFDLYEKNSLFDAATPINGEEQWNYVGFIPLVDVPLDNLSEGKTGGGAADASYN